MFLKIIKVVLGVVTFIMKCSKNMKFIHSSALSGFQLSAQKCLLLHTTTISLPNVRTQLLCTAVLKRC